MESAPRPQGRGGPGGPRPVHNAAATRLAEQLRELAASATAPEDMLEPALRAVLQASGADAGALCLFDRRHELLRLATEVGLSDEGCAKLRQVRRGDLMGWDMPLHGLLNRRVYLIESAARNRYVPKLVEAAGSVTAIACVPLYAGATPIASIVLVALAPARITEQQLGPLSEPLRALARMIETVRQRGTSSAAAPAAAPRPPVRPAAERPAAESGRGDTARVQALLAQLAEAERERARLAAALEAATAERAERARTEASADSARGAERAAEVERLTARLTEAETAAARERDLVSASGRERERLATALREATEREQGIQEAVRAVGAGSSATHEDELWQAVAAARAAEEARVAADAEAEVAHAALARAEAAVRALEDEKQHARDEIEKLRASASGLLAERHRLEQGLEEARIRELEAREQVADLERQIAALREARQADAAERTAQLEGLRTRLAEAEAAAASGSTQVGEWERERDRLAAELSEAAAREQRAVEELQVASERAAGVTREDLRSALEKERAAEEARAAANAEAEAARAALARTEAAVAELERERERAREQIAQLQAGAGAMHAERERLERGLTEARAREDEARASLGDLEARAAALRGERAAEAAALSAQIEDISAERDRLSAALTAVQAERDYFAAEEAAADVAHARLEEALVREAAGRATAAEVPAPPVVQRAPSDVAGHVVVLDDDPAWAETATDDLQVTVMPAAAGGHEKLVGAPPTCVVANLATRGALAALEKLRAAGFTARVWGCLTVPAMGQALPLGPVEPVARPLDPGAVLIALRQHAGRGAHVLIAGADADAMISLRQALVREGMVVSMAWDGAQAMELLGTRHPEVVVVDLALPEQAGYVLVAQLAACDPPPVTVLVPDEEEAADAFAAVLPELAPVSRLVPLADLLVHALGQ